MSPAREEAVSDGLQVQRHLFALPGFGKGKARRAETTLAILCTVCAT